MDKIICFGDSNTYGAHGFTGGRYHKDERWTGLIESALGCRVINAGQNGREIPTDRWDMAEVQQLLRQEAPFDLFVVMLGSNDLLMMFKSGMPKIVARMETFLKEVLKMPAIYGDGRRILLIAPPPTQLGRYGSDGDHFDKISLEFADSYLDLANKLGVRFANAGRWHVDIGPDGVHFTGLGQKKFAGGLEKVLGQIRA